ncbi:MAG: hypothetical protein JWN43_3518 [Gammaproteobacteria bacterium]|nr:hypothetical protein [Gammaproteobacteria bacterium]
MCAFAIWSLTHEYRGLAFDGQIYAVQALAKLRPALNADLFLQNTTQDRFTIFPDAYAWVISCIGLNPAALLLTALFSIWFLYAAWTLTAHLFDRGIAWLAIFLLIVTGGHYGAFGVFQLLEPFLTARLPAEALIVTALGLYLRGFERVAFAVAAAALFLHPLMALPGLLLLICMRVPGPASLAGAAVGVLGCLGLAFAATAVPVVRHALPIMDAAWLDIVRERSQFLFVQLWTMKDWELTARPFVCLTLSFLALRDPRIRRLALCAMLVGATGLLIAGIASLIGPVAVFMQGQAWRWVWIAALSSIIMLFPTARQMWSEDRLGPVCALLLMASWSFSANIGFVFASLALVLWTLRGERWLQPSQVPRWTAAAAVVSIIGMAIVDTRSVSGVRSILGLKVWCVSLVLLTWYWIRSARSPAVPILVGCVCAASSAFLVHQSSVNSKSFGTPSDMTSFTDWRQAIPPSGTVFVTNGHDSGSFVWFTLERNNYLSPGQSAGVVFSRATALEVRRRSEMLLPLVDPNWKMLTSLRRTRSSRDTEPQRYRPLTPQSLVDVCRDAALDFVISPDDVGFAPVRHTRSDAYQNWNLYDCNRVRALALIS